MGKVTFLKGEECPHFERDIYCKDCGRLTLDEVELPELGQSELTELYFMLKNYRELKVWEKAYQLCLKICKLVRDFPVEERYGLSL